MTIRARRIRSARAISTPAAGAVSTLVVVVGLLSFYAATTGPLGAHPTIELCGGTLQEVTVQYTGNSSGFLRLGYGVEPAYCTAQSVAPYSDLVVPLFLHSDDLWSAHVVTALTIESPFHLLVVSPALPEPILPGGNLTVNVALQAPGSAGEFAPAGTVMVE